MKSQENRPILVATDLMMSAEANSGEPSVPVIAAALARKLGVKLDVAHVAPAGFGPVRDRALKGLIRRTELEQQKRLQKLAVTLGRSTRAIFLKGDPAKQLLAHLAGRKQYDFVVLGTHSYRGISRVIMGSIAEEMIRQSRVPVCTVNSRAQKSYNASEKDEKPTIVIATSLESTSQRAEIFGMQLARRLGAEVVFFHSLRESLHPTLQTALANPILPPQMVIFVDERVKVAERQLEKLRRKAASLGLSSRCVLDQELYSASEAILKMAEQFDVSYIVMGTRGRSLASGIILGRTARDVLLEAKVPVFTVRSPKTG